MEEERRLAYVGITRAKKRLFITFAANRQIHGLWQGSIPSRFISELPKKIINENIFPKLWDTSKNKSVVLRFVFSFDFTKTDLKNLISRINNIKIDY